MPKPSTQQLIAIETVREGVIMLDGGSLRAVLMCSSLNFALKSEEEQQAITFQFQSFINSLDFSIQILVQSRKLNIAEYLEKLGGLEERQANELLRLHTAEYREFIRGLVEMSSIMTKAFYVVVPYDVFVSTKAGLGAILGKHVAMKPEEFLRSRDQLAQRVGFVMDGLRRTGIQSVPLNTQELIELLWGFYNPEEAELGKVPEIPETIY